MFSSFINSDESTDNSNKLLNLMSNINFNEPETPIPLFTIPKDEAMQIYLRLRPLPKSQSISPFSITHNTIIANPPENSISYKNLLHGNGKGYQKFTFSRIFPIDQSSQPQIFTETTKPIISDFLQGHDRLLFTYGTTSSGKTFTMNGSRHNIGIIPRTLHQLFQSENLSNNPYIMPIDYAEVCHLKTPDAQKILKEKSQLLKLSEKETSELLSVFDSSSNSDLSNDAENVNPNSNGNHQTTFWISFTEIYNEMIYDLLDPTTAPTAAGGNSNGYNKLRRPILEIRTARNGGAYVKGLRQFPVFSAEEAYRLLLVGRRHQSVGATKLNANSSRSHTIVTIRAVRTLPKSEWTARVGVLAFCDLAGSERSDKAQTHGGAQREAGNINASLLALGRCVEVLRQNNGGNVKLVPYRDSKLTRLFQTFLGGGAGKAAMVVCINPDGGLFDESLQVLKFSALARRVVLHERVRPDCRVTVEGSVQRPSMYHRLGMRLSAHNEGGGLQSILANDSDDDSENDALDETLADNDAGTDEDTEFEEEYDVKELLDIIDRLKAELIATRKEKVANEARLRETINTEWSKTIMEMERDNARNVQQLRKEMQNDMMKRTRAERNKAFNQMKKRRLQPVSSEEEEPRVAVGGDGSAGSDSGNDSEANELRARLKEAEEELADAVARADEQTRCREQLEVRCRELEFRAVLLAGRSSATARDSGSVAAQAVGSDRQVRAVPAVASGGSRFSIISRNPAASSLTVDGGVGTQQHSDGHSFFGPLHSVQEEAASAKVATIAATPLRNKPLFEIYVEDGDEDESDFSFLQREEECHIEEQLARIGGGDLTCDSSDTQSSLSDSDSENTSC